MLVQQEEAWADATSNEGLDDVRNLPSVPPKDIDMAMICDIQRIVARLVGKASQLIGKVQHII